MAIAESSSSRRKRGVSYRASSRVQVLFRALLFALSLLLVACGGPAEPTPTTHTTGSLAITVQGLASGAAADIEVNGPGDFGANVGASTLLEELEPGSYTLLSAPVTDHDLVSPATITAMVVAGEEATATITYQASAFNLDADLDSLRFTLGGEAQLNLTLQRLNDFAGDVTVTAQTPEGLELDEANWTFTAGDTTFTVTVSDDSAPLGASTITFTATGLLEGATVSSITEVEVRLGAVVTAWSDPVPGLPGTLRYLVDDERTEGATITFDPAMLDFGSSINLSQELVIEHDLTIQGPERDEGHNPAVALNGGNAVRAVRIDNTASVILSDVELRNGLVNDGDGGGVLVTSGSELTLLRSELRNNEAKNGGGIHSRGTLTLVDSLIFENTATGNGGGIWTADGIATITDSSITRNVAAGNGGGFHLGTGTLNLVNSSVTSNEAADGGGVFAAHAGAWELDASFLNILDGSKIAWNEASRGAGVLSYVTARIENSEITDNIASAAGGGVRNHLTMEIINSKINHNEAATRYGGLFNDGVMTIRDSEILFNKAGTHGGGIFNGYFASDKLHHLTKKLIVERTVISGNSAGGDGGGIHSIRHLEVIDSDINGNNAGGHGGGIYAVTIANANTEDKGGEVHVSGSTIRNNVASGTGGGLYSNTEYPNGVGIVAKAPMTIVNSTFEGNEAEHGGGISMAGINDGEVRISFSTIADNEAVGVGGQGGGVHTAREPVWVRGNIVANNTSEDGGNSNDLYFSLGGLTSEGYNLFGTTPQNIALKGTDITNSNPRLNSLWNNGGPTPTMELLNFSPALDHVPAAHCLGPDGTPLTHDQRGEPRPAGTNCDIGAFERQP